MANCNRRDFFKGLSLAAAGAALQPALGEGTTLVAPEMAKGLSRPGQLQTVEHEVDVCVVGGGMGGLLTAISAARQRLFRQDEQGRHLDVRQADARQRLSTRGRFRSRSRAHRRAS